MRRAATSAFALTLPQPRSTKVVSIDGRQRVERIPGNELYFVLWGGRRRSVYQQFDGELILADECSCTWDWQPDFEVTRSVGCKIDQHKAEARRKEDW